MFPIDFFYRAARRRPERVAIDAPMGNVTYGELLAQVGALARGLQELDPAPQSRVAICAMNSVEHILSLLAVMAAGKVWVPLNARSTRAELARAIEATQPGILMTDSQCAHLIDTGSGLRISMDGQDDTAHATVSALLARYQGQSPVPCRLPLEAIQAIKFTGGTTGFPKGVMQSYRVWNAVIANQIIGWGLTPQDRYVVAAPVSHGTSTYVLPILAQGGMHVLLDGVTPAAITDAFRQRGGTLSFMPPTLIYMLMAQPGVSRADFPALRCLIYGGAPMPVEKIGEVRECFGPVLGTTYGQTEAPQIVSLMRTDDFEDVRNWAAVGTATWQTDIAILDSEGRRLPAGEIGEVAVRGALVMNGYWRLPEQTRAAFRSGWLCTGDGGFLDERGFLYLKDRLKDMIITGGFNIYPIEVEGALALHPAVYESTVFGVPDDKWGEAVHAAVQLRPGQSTDERDLIAHVKERLGSVHAPKRIFILDTLPRSTVGKVLKNEARAQAIGLAVDPNRLGGNA